MNAKWLVSLLAYSTMFAAESKVKQATGEVIRSRGKIQTGSSSRIELELPYLGIVRVGSNSDFKFSADYKEMDLDSGTLLAAIPKGVGDVIVRAGPVAAVMDGGVLEMANVGGNAKVIVLSGKVEASLTANPSKQKTLRYGHMVDVKAGATRLPGVVAINLKTLIGSSTLFKMGDFPGRKAVEKNADKQVPKHSFKVGALGPDGLEPVLGIANAAMTTEQIANQQQAAIAAANLAAAAQQQLEASRQLAAQQRQQQIVTEQRIAAEQAARVAQQQRAAVAAGQPVASTGNQGNAFGPQGNQGQGPQGNQGQGNQGQGNQGNQGQGNNPPGQGGTPPGQQ